jgi:hypothetical protein
MFRWRGMVGISRRGLRRRKSEMVDLILARVGETLDSCAYEDMVLLVRMAHSYTYQIKFEGRREHSNGVPRRE